MPDWDAAYWILDSNFNFNLKVQQIQKTYSERIHPFT